jgi:hypothetical protein
MRITTMHCFMYTLYYVQLCAEDLLQLAKSHSTNDTDESNLVSTWMEDKLRSAATLLFSHYKHLQWIAVTNGLLPAVLFCRADYVYTESEAKQTGHFTQFHRYHASFMEPSQSESGSITAGLITALIAGSSMIEAFRRALAADDAVASRDSNSNSSNGSINGSNNSNGSSSIDSDSVRAVRHEVVTCK